MVLLCVVAIKQDTRSNHSSGQGLVVLGRELLGNVWSFEENEDLGKTAFFLRHCNLHRLAIGALDLCLKRGKDVVVERGGTAWDANADEALASHLIFQNPQGALGENLPGLCAIALIS